MNSLLINLTRLGDLLQMQPVLHGLHDLDRKTGILCLENFMPAAEMLNDLDYAAILPGGGLLAALDRDWREALTRFDACVRRSTRDFPADEIFNFTATLPARLLARRLNIAAGEQRPISGFGLDSYGFGLSGDGWATFLQGSSIKRVNCPFNLVDMFRKSAGVAHLPARNNLRRPDAKALERAGEALARRCGPGSGYVCFQLGASDSRRQWPVAHFAEVGRRLYEESGFYPILLGSPAERRLAEEYSALAKHPHADMVGATSLPELAALLCQSSLLISNDTGTMHLSAGLGIPVLAIFLATAQPFDTGPYMENCCCLEPALPCHPCSFQQQCAHNNICREHIKPGFVFSLASAFLAGGGWPAKKNESTRVWVSGKDKYGFMDLTSLSGHENEDRSLWLAIQKIFYRHILDKINGGHGARPQPDPGLRASLSEGFRVEATELMRRAEGLLLLLLEQGKMLLLKPDQVGGRKILAASSRLHDLLSQNQALCALGFLWQTLSQERGDDIGSFISMASQMREDLAYWREYLEYGGSGPEP